MNGISAWLLSIAGVSVLSVVVDILLPKGQTEKYIKGIFAFVMILVIIAPLPKLLKAEINFNEIFQKEEIKLQEDFIYQQNQNKLTLLKKEIESDLKENNLDGVEVSIYGDIFSDEMQIEKIFVDLTNLVINDKNQHIDIEKTVIETIQKYVLLEKEKIEFNE